MRDVSNFIEAEIQPETRYMANYDPKVSRARFVKGLSPEFREHIAEVNRGSIIPPDEWLKTAQPIGRYLGRKKIRGSYLWFGRRGGKRRHKYAGRSVNIISRIGQHLHDLRRSKRRHYVLGRACDDESDYFLAISFDDEAPAMDEAISELAVRLIMQRGHDGIPG